MKTGIELIKKERNQQIKKHRFSLKWDKTNNTDGQLVQAALCCIEKVGRGIGFTNEYHPWPSKWDAKFENKIRFKDDVGKLIVAGAFYMAENDRLGEPKYEPEIKNTANRIDEIHRTGKCRRCGKFSICDECNMHSELSRIAR